MNNQEIKDIFKRLNLPTQGKQYVERVRTSPPARAVEAGAFNVVDRIASRKMRMVITSESRGAELPFLLFCELNKSILEFYNQPEQIKINYIKNDGKRRATWVTFDFLIIKENEIALIECKKEDDLRKLCITHPEKFVFDQETSRYICPPAIESCNELGLNHYISTDKDFTSCFIRNCSFLFNFIDDTTMSEEEGNEISSYIQQQGNRIKLVDLSKIFTQKKVIQAIFNSFVFCDLDSQLLLQSDLTWIYPSSTCMLGYANLHAKIDLIPVRAYHELANAAHIFIGTDKFDVISCEADSLLVRGNTLLPLSKKEVYELIEAEKLYIPDLTSSLKKNTDSLLDNYTESEIEKALGNLYKFEQYKKGNKQVISDSTFKRWRKKMQRAKETLGSEIFGLIERNRDKGNRTSRIPTENIKLIERKVNEIVLTPAGANVHFAFLAYINSCRKNGIKPASMTTFYKRSKATGEYEFTLKREGLKAAYALGPKPLNTNPNFDAPPTADFVFQLAHIDHTPLELDFISALNGKPFTIRIHLTLLKDSYSLKVLAVYISFETPSYRSCMMVLRECFRIYNRLPLWIMCDGGSEFKSIYFQENLANFGVNIRYRPKSAYRHGTPAERNFGISEQQLIHNLKGNRKLKKYGRRQTPSHDSAKFALWTPDEFLIELKEYFYETFPEVSSAGIKETPQERFNYNKSLFDELPGVKIDNEAIFNFKTLPVHKKQLTLHKNQLTFQGISYRLAKPIIGYEFGKTMVDVKYDPYDCQCIYVYLNDTWTKMTTQDQIVKACRDRGIILGFLEIYSKKIKHGRDYRKGSEALLKAQQKIEEKEAHLFNQKNAIFSPPTTTLPDSVTDSTTPDVDYENLDVVPTTKL